jgi:Cu(I)/Ag(I) efflux system membrane fusion protein
VVVSSRVSGRVDRQYVRETGRSIRSGEPFLELYSEQLMTYQKEYLLALDQAGEFGGKNARYEQFVRSARQKLIRYGLSEAQVNELQRTRKASERITFVSPAGGVVTALSVAEGQYVNEGSTLYLLEDISSLWVEAELYPGEAEQARPGQQVTIKIAGFEDKSLEALVTFVTPEYRQNTQMTIMRARLANPARIYQPGMQAQVILRHDVRKALALPVDAVIRDADRSFVFVMTARNRYERRDVTTGLEDTDQVEVTSGLKEGEEVVITGAYLLNSEMILKGLSSANDHTH